MATITYTFVRRCEGGGHTVLGISVNAGQAEEIVYDTDDIRRPLSELTDDQRDLLKLLILKVHMAGKNRQQIINEFQAGPVTVTI